MTPLAVVITGMGAVGAFGCGRNRLAEALRQSRPTFSSVDRSGGFHRPGSAISAALVRDFTPADWIPPLRARRMSNPSRYAVAAARMALDDSGLEAAEQGYGETGVVLATCFGSTNYCERMLRQVFEEGPEAASPALFTESVANAPAARVALELSAHGPNITVTQREAGPLVALHRAAREIASGRLRRVLAGAVEEMPPLLHAMLDRFGALSRDRADNGTEIARPFDRDRGGGVAGEGASVLVLERETDARARGAAIRARVRTLGGAFDPTAPPTGWGDGDEELAAALERRLLAAGLEAADVDCIVSGASGAYRGDRLEARVLAAVWRDRELPPVLVPKTVTGEYGGGILAPALLAVEGETFGPTCGFREADPALGVVPHDGSPLRPSRALLTALAAGGAAHWTVLEAPDG